MGLQKNNWHVWKGKKKSFHVSKIFFHVWKPVYPVNEHSWEIELSNFPKKIAADFHVSSEFINKSFLQCVQKPVYQVN